MAAALDAHEDEVPNVNILIIGEGGVGKKTLVRRLLGGDFEEGNIIETTVSRRIINTNRGRVKISFYINKGQWGIDEIRYGESFEQGPIGVILAFDVSSRVTYRQLPHWHRDCQRRYGNLHTVVVGTKSDKKPPEVKPAAHLFHRQHKIQYFEVSAKGNLLVEKPIAFLLKALQNDHNLEILEPMAIIDSNLNINQEGIRQMEQAIEEAQHAPILDEDEVFVVPMRNEEDLAMPDEVEEEDEEEEEEEEEELDEVIILMPQEELYDWQ